MEITAAQRKKLKAMAHHLNALVLVGKNGVTESLIASADKALTDHELIKVKFVDHKEEKKDLVARITSDTCSVFVSMIGNVAVIYRESSEPEKQSVSRAVRAAG